MINMNLHFTELVSGEISPQETDPTDFKRRFLKKIRRLGEVLDLLCTA